MTGQFKSQKQSTQLGDITRLLQRGPLDTRQISVRLGMKVATVSAVINRNRHIFASVGRSQINKNVYVWALKETDHAHDSTSVR